jgi:hypothetical protein
MPEPALARYLDGFREVVGTGALVDLMAPSRRHEQWFREWWARGERLSAGHEYFVRILDLFLRTDVRPALASIQAPTLVLRRTDDWHVRRGHALHLVERVPDARLVELPGADHVWFSGDTDAWLDAVEHFVAGERSSSTSSRVLATVLFTDIVGSTERAAAVGDAEWMRVLEAHDALVARQVAAFRGTVVKHTGDGVLATFDGPARAIECALEVVRAVRALGIEIRAGLHTGAKSRSRATTCTASRCTSPPASSRWPGPARCWSPRRCRRWSSVPASASWTGVRTRSRACPTSGTSSWSEHHGQRHGRAPRRLSHRWPG